MGKATYFLLAALACAGATGPTGALATTTVVDQPAILSEHLRQAIQVFSTAPASTDWVCFQNTDVLVQEVANQTGGLASFVPVVERSDTNPTNGANPAEAYQEGHVVGGPSAALLFKEPGMGWWRVRVVGTMTGNTADQGYASSTAFPINITLSGKGCPQ